MPACLLLHSRDLFRDSSYEMEEEKNDHMVSQLPPPPLRLSPTPTAASASASKTEEIVVMSMHTLDNHDLVHFLELDYRLGGRRMAKKRSIDFFSPQFLSL